MTLYIAFNYGGRAEIVDAAARAARPVARESRRGAAEAAGRRRSRTRHRRLAATSTPPRCTTPSCSSARAASMRISNFLLWQCAYSELYFSDKLWPDFGRGGLDEALAEYAHRQRRFGGR